MFIYKISSIWSHFYQEICISKTQDVSNLYPHFFWQLKPLFDLFTFTQFKLFLFFSWLMQMRSSLSCVLLYLILMSNTGYLSLLHSFCLPLKLTTCMNQIYYFHFCFSFYVSMNQICPSGKKISVSPNAFDSWTVGSWKSRSLYQDILIHMSQSSFWNICCLLRFLKWIRHTNKNSPLLM